MRAITPVLLALTLVGAACAPDGRPDAGDGTTRATGVEAGHDESGDDTSSDDGGDDDDPTGGAGQLPRALAPFDGCDAFLSYVRAEAMERVGPYGLDGQGGGHWFEGDMAVDGETTAAGDTGDVGADAGAIEAPTPGGDTDGVAAPSTGGGHTGTNVQETGVDEPDLVKTDGRRIVTLRDGVVTIVDTTLDAPAIVGELALGDDLTQIAEMVLHGDRVVLVGTTWGDSTVTPLDEPTTTDAEAEFADDESSRDAPDTFGPTATIVEIDVSDDAAPRVVATLRVEGSHLSARLIGDHLRIAMSSSPDELPWLSPQSRAGEARATEANREIIAESTLTDWLPDYRLTGDGLDAQGQLLACDRLHHPAAFSGFDMISILDVSLADGLSGGIGARDAVGVLAGGQTVYSSTDRFYVATTRWTEPEPATGSRAGSVIDDRTEDVQTDLHAFAISPGEPTEYLASGSVAGTLLNQFSMDEHAGHLRVLTTDGTPWSATDTTETRLVVLAEDGDRLVPVGQVGGLGEGEQLSSARLLDEVGFAVTFRRIDPFYVLDLSDPTDPRVTGELKIPGLSTYLHPLDDDRVLGIGQDATEEGGTLGLKLSMFDVSDPAAPREIDVWTMRDATSPVEGDHRAFQIVGDLAVVPVHDWMDGLTGTMVFDLSNGITEVGRIEPVAPEARPTDCRVLTIHDVPEESEYRWIVEDEWTVAQLCGPDDEGGLAADRSAWCEIIPIADLEGWVGDDADAIGERLDAGPDDRIELCYPDGAPHEAVDRTVVIDGTIWTLSPTMLQANALDDLMLETVIELP